MRHLSIAILLLLLLYSAVSRYQFAAHQTSRVAVRHPRGAYAEVNGVKLWYESEGSGPPLLLIAGGPGMAHYFHPYFSVLSDSYRVICFDGFGRGKSDRAETPAQYSFERDVDDVEGLRKALGLGRIAVLGHSYGGMVAQAYALKYPHSVSRLILTNTLSDLEIWRAARDQSNNSEQSGAPKTWDFQQFRIPELLPGAPEQGASNILLGMKYFHQASVPESLPRDLVQLNPDVYCAIAGGCTGFLAGNTSEIRAHRPRLPKALSRIKVPVLIVAGRYDTIASPRLLLQVKRHAPGARVVTFERSGHFPFIEEPQKFFSILRSFLQPAGRKQAVLCPAAAPAHSRHKGETCL